ncbi:MAG: DUF3301 domain-containing protein [Aromatoleum sp.]|jgi:hypothetical protein|uniref:DUF3301 domain-containing protein n=1 Tax=Aromatoleum sp. TaxID=2307007 RepID=UPI002895BB16|nr:DUF3301 domain-containing protein [Aromatoleum sp.]MDT3671646.1 DUF3301 domain-containing protein [Aromatoleum sp.]
MLSVSAIELLGFALLCALGWYWFDSVRARDIAVEAARAACRREDVQLLDETVAGRSVRAARDDDGRLRLRRVYDFEFSSSGNDRRRGSLVLLGGRVVMLDVDLGPTRASTFTLY